MLKIKAIMELSYIGGSKPVFQKSIAASGTSITKWIPGKIYLIWHTKGASKVRNGERS